MPRESPRQWRSRRPGGSPQAWKPAPARIAHCLQWHGTSERCSIFNRGAAAEQKKADPGSRPGSAAKHARPLPRDPDAPAALCTASRNSDATALATFDDTAKHTGDAITCIASSAPSTPRRPRVSRHGCYKGFRQRSTQLDAPGRRQLHRPDTGRENHPQHTLRRSWAHAHRLDPIDIFSGQLRCSAAPASSRTHRLHRQAASTWNGYAHTSSPTPVRCLHRLTTARESVLAAHIAASDVGRSRILAREPLRRMHILGRNVQRLAQHRQRDLHTRAARLHGHP
ncbi:hypothetical protein XCM_16890 [Xanthomonas citri pv. mangiferaeindicae]|nr:hypothetical protein XCM_16890 [Xanthomonas citri pv. mangiferaeindicae]